MREKERKIGGFEADITNLVQLVGSNGLGQGVRDLYRSYVKGEVVRGRVEEINGGSASGTDNSAVAEAVRQRDYMEKTVSCGFYLMSSTIHIWPFR